MRRTLCWAVQHRFKHVSTMHSLSATAFHRNSSTGPAGTSQQPGAPGSADDRENSITPQSHLSTSGRPEPGTDEDACSAARRERRREPSDEQGTQPRHLIRFFSNKVWAEKKDMYAAGKAVVKYLRRTENIRLHDIICAMERMGHHSRSPPKNVNVARMAVEFLSSRVQEDSGAILSTASPEQLTRLVWGIAMLHSGSYFLDRSLTTTAWPWERIDDAALGLAEELSPKSLCKLLWAFSKLEHTPRREVLEALRDRAMELMPLLSAWELANAAGAFTRMDFSPGEDFLVSCTAAAHIIGPQNFSPRGLCMLMHCFGMCGWLPGPALMHEVGQAVAASCRDFSTRELSNLVWSFASIGYYPVDTGQPAMLLNVIADELAHRGPGSLATQDIAQLFWGLGMLQHHPGPECMAMLLEASERAVDRFKPEELVNTLWGASILESTPPSSAFLHATSGAVAARAKEFTPQGLSNAMLVYAKFHHRNRRLLMVAERQMGASLHAFNGQDTASMMHALSRLKHKPAPPLLRRVEDFAVSRVQDLTTEELQKICTALSRMDFEPRDEALVSLVSARMERDTTFTPEELESLEEALRHMTALRESGSSGSVSSEVLKQEQEAAEAWETQSDDTRGGIRIWT